MFQALALCQSKWGTQHHSSLENYPLYSWFWTSIHNIVLSSLSSYIGKYLISWRHWNTVYCSYCFSCVIFYLDNIRIDDVGNHSLTVNYIKDEEKIDGGYLAAEA